MFCDRKSSISQLIETHARQQIGMQCVRKQPNGPKISGTALIEVFIHDAGELSKASKVNRTEY